MKRILQLLLFVTIGFILLVSCEKDEPLPKMRLCDDKENFYWKGKTYPRSKMKSLQNLY